MQYVTEDVYSPFQVLRVYGTAVIGLVLIVVVFASKWELGVSMLLCVNNIPLAVYCAYYISDQHIREKWVFRLKMALLTGVACGIMLSDGGMELRDISPVEGMIWGFCAAVLAYLFAMVTDGIATPALRLIRCFYRRGYCPQCGYNLRGLTSLRCPECGLPVQNSSLVNRQLGRTMNTADEVIDDDAKRRRERREHPRRGRHRWFAGVREATARGPWSSWICIQDKEIEFSRNGLVPSWIRQNYTRHSGLGR